MLVESGGGSIGVPMASETYTFTLVLDGPRSIDEDLEDRLYEAGCDDALLSLSNGVLCLDFDREAASLSEAILSAVLNVEDADVEATVVRVEPDDLVTASEIASRTGRSRESIRLLAMGRRGAGGFPAPVRGVKSHARHWRWAEVASWLAEHEGAAVQTIVSEARTIAAINAALDLRRHASDPVGLLRSLPDR